jgi:hypothetical protein
MESEPVGSGDEEVTFSLLRFPAVNVKPLLRSRSYAVTSHYQLEEVELQQRQNTSSNEDDEQTENDDHNDFFQK